MRNLIMKMDVEGCEWDIFSETPSEIINQFSQMVVEFHGLSPFIEESKHQTIICTLQKINLTHQCIHVHANSYPGVPAMIGGLVLPPLLEVTFIRRSDFEDRLIENKRQFPTELDQPTIAGWPDILLRRFSAEN